MCPQDCPESRWPENCPAADSTEARLELAGRVDQYDVLAEIGHREMAVDTALASFFATAASPRRCPARQLSRRAPQGCPTGHSPGRARVAEARPRGHLTTSRPGWGAMFVLVVARLGLSITCGRLPAVGELRRAGCGTRPFQCPPGGGRPPRAGRLDSGPDSHRGVRQPAHLVLSEDCARSLRDLRRNSESIAGSRSTAVTSAPSAQSLAVSLPVPAPRSSTRRPGRTARDNSLILGPASLINHSPASTLRSATGEPRLTP